MFNLAARYVRRIKELEAQLAEARQRLKAVDMLQADRPVLVSIAKHGKELRLMFVRNSKVTILETYATIDLDVAQLKADLLEPQNDQTR